MLLISAFSGVSFASDVIDKEATEVADVNDMVNVSGVVIDVGKFTIINDAFLKNETVKNTVVFESENVSEDVFIFTKDLTYDNQVNKNINQLSTKRHYRLIQRLCFFWCN